MDDLQMFRMFVVLETILFLLLGLGAITSAWRGLEVRNWISVILTMLVLSFAFHLMVPKLLSPEAVETIRNENRRAAKRRRESMHPMEEVGLWLQLLL